MECIYSHADLLRVYKAILQATQEISTWIAGHSPKKIGTFNHSGDEQTDLDVKSVEIVVSHLK
jgi:fructose-1,6-bisphosphatase